MRIWQRPFTPDEAMKSRAGTMMEHLNIEITEIGDDFLSARMPVDHRTKQPFGIMHGGASCVLAETVGSIAASYCIDLSQFTCVGVEINTSHIKAIREGFVTGTARPYHIGRSTQVWGIEIRDGSQSLISVSRLRMAILERRG